jgi:hypothetical protein
VINRPHSSLILASQNAFIDEAINRTNREQKMKLIKSAMLAVALSATLVTAAQAHPFIGVGIVGGPVFPVASGTMSAPPLPVYARSASGGPAPLPSDAPPVSYQEPAVANIASIMGHANASAMANTL